MGNILPRPVPVPIPIPVKYHHRITGPVVDVHVVEPAGALGHLSVLVIPVFGQYEPAGQGVHFSSPVGEYVPGLHKGEVQDVAPTLDV
jgi:hypothetical protein